MTNILLAEDNPGDVVLVREALAAHGIENNLHVVTDGGSAMKYIAQMGEGEGQPCPDLVLLDMNLPQADGAAVLTAFRAHSACTTTPVIVVSSVNSAKEWTKVASLGVSYYFRKPAVFDEFMKLGEVVKSLLEAKD